MIDYSQYTNQEKYPALYAEAERLAQAAGCEVDEWAICDAVEAEGGLAQQLRQMVWQNYRIVLDRSDSIEAILEAAGDLDQADTNIYESNTGGMRDRIEAGWRD